METINIQLSIEELRIGKENGKERNQKRYRQNEVNNNLKKYQKSFICQSHLPCMWQDIHGQALHTPMACL